MPYRTWPKSTFSMYEWVAQTVDLTLTTTALELAWPFVNCMLD